MSCQLKTILPCPLPLSGYQAFPPLFALGYHQCRWNYEDEADVKAVDAGFDRHNIPYDVVWLDIDHTNEKRYFTWDYALFPDPVGLQCHLDKKKRKVSLTVVFTQYINNLLNVVTCFRFIYTLVFQLVVINDPHIKIDPDWSLYREARDGGHFVRHREGQIFQGSCWPGNIFSNSKITSWNLN